MVDICKHESLPGEITGRRVSMQGFCQLYFKVHLPFLFESISSATKLHQIFCPGLKNSRCAS